jgi:TetR/AcrR family transcriptional regulator, transcriptional repressor for nem operon
MSVKIMTIMKRIQNHEEYHLKVRRHGKEPDMKVNKETMAGHREDILASASKRFRESGFDGVSVGQLMQEAGLTHGGFYGHFSSKEELATLAAERAMSDSLVKWEKVLHDATGDPIEALARHYLSQRHLKNPGTGCIFPSLGADISRQPASLRGVVTERLGRIFSSLTAAIRGRSEQARRRKAIAVFAGLVGGMVLARSVDDPALAQEILDSVSESLPRLAGPAIQ